jgi:NADH-quinone oxidoreductase subunit E
MTEKKTILSEKIRKDIDAWVIKYPPEQKQSAVLSALMIVQEDNGGWLTNELVESVAQYLDMPTIAAFEVASFYSMYDLQPVGRYKINVCNSISCLLNGSEKIIAHLCKRLNVKVGETTADGLFTLKKAECLAACIGAPACVIGPDYHENLTPEKMDAILDKLEGTPRGK